MKRYVAELAFLGTVLVVFVGLSVASSEDAPERNAAAAATKLHGCVKKSGVLRIVKKAKCRKGERYIASGCG